MINIVLPTGLSDLLLLPSLRSLDLSECLHINGTEMVKGLKGSDAARRQLETVNLRSCTYIRVGHCLRRFVRFKPDGKILASCLSFRILQFSFSPSCSGTLSASLTWLPAVMWLTCPCAQSPPTCRSWWCCGSAGVKKLQTGVCWEWCKEPNVSLTRRRWESQLCVCFALSTCGCYNNSL